LFPTSYAASRARFRASLEWVRRLWPAARLESHALDGDDDTTIDWIAADAAGRAERALCLTMGQHGLEGYLGSAMIQLFQEEYLPRLEPATTSVTLVHAINPWGMKHGWRTNAQNVDLNRNFKWEVTAFSRDGNGDYAVLREYLNPPRAIGALWRENVAFALDTVRALRRLGAGRVQRAALLGQGMVPTGIYYAGQSYQEETAALMALYRRMFRSAPHVLLLDMHSGYGPAMQMSVILSPLEQAGSDELARRCNYPRFVKTDAPAFYAMDGDMVDWAYYLAREEAGLRRFFGAAFEFGTLGDSLLAGADSLRRTVQGNQLRWFGAADEATGRRVWEEYRGLYLREDEPWRAKCLADARQAFSGILRAEGFIAAGR